MRRRIISACVGALVAVAVFAGLALATGALKAAGKAKVTNYANRITAPTTSEVHDGSGAPILEVPGVARITVRGCSQSDARAEVRSLSSATSRILSTSPGIAPYPQFRPAETPEFSISTLEGPGWLPFYIADQSPPNERNQIATFHIEGGTGSATMIADFSVVFAPENVFTPNECTFAATAQVFKG